MGDSCAITLRYVTHTLCCLRCVWQDRRPSHIYSRAQLLEEACITAEDMKEAGAQRVAVSCGLWASCVVLQVPGCEGAGSAELYQAGWGTSGYWSTFGHCHICEYVPESSFALFANTCGDSLISIVRTCVITPACCSVAAWAVQACWCSRSMTTRSPGRCTVSLGS